MTPTELDRIEEELVATLCCHAFDDVARQAIRYCRAAESHARALGANHQDLLLLARRVDKLLCRAHLTIATARSQWAADLDRIATLHQYLRPSPEKSSAPGLTA
jgi:hypothetical protein